MAHTWPISGAPDTTTMSTRDRPADIVAAGDLTLHDVCRVARAVGLAPSFRLYPTGEPIRDSAQLALLIRFEQLVTPPLHLVREVPLPIAGDLRAWDGRIRDRSGTASVEGESRITDAQALARRIALKTRDDPGAGAAVRIFTLVAETPVPLIDHQRYRPHRLDR